MEALTYDAVVLTGGAARRLGGASKPDVEVRGEPLIASALRAARDARVTVVVGPPTAHHPASLTTREEPPGGGPVAAIAAGLQLLPEGAEWVLCLACDTPRAADAVPELVCVAGEAAAAVTAVVGVDDGGIRQPLLALYRRRALDAGLGAIDVESASMKALLAPLDVAEVSLPAGSARDLDTWEDVERARRELT